MEKNKLSKKDRYHLKHQRIVPYDYMEKFKKGSIRYLIELWKYKKWRKKLYLIKMYKKSGWLDTFTIATGGYYFEYNDGYYYIDPDLVTSDTLSPKLPCLTYHENVSCPFKVEFNMDKLSKSLETMDDKNIRHMLNPVALKQFFESKVIENIIAGGALTDKLRIMYMMIIGILILAALTFIIMLNHTGVFKG